MNTLAISQLKAADACASSVSKFRELFGESADVTLENVEKAQAAGLSFSWAASALLTPAARAEYDKATAAAFLAGVLAS